jgi:chromosome segregation ATPase
MKIKIAIVILAIACVGLGITLFATKKQSDEQHTADVTSMLELSNQLVGATIQLNDFRVANVNLTNDLASSRQQLALTGQQAEQLSNSLAAATATLENTRTSLAAARDQITNLNTHVSDLETQNKVLDQRASELTNTIAQLSAAIENTQNRLAIAETNRAFIEQELQKQMAQKAELEHKFNDLNEVRAQVKKLRDEIFIARRIQLMKNDNGQKKGAELLMQRTPAVTNPSAATAGHQTNYNLNVEVGSDGSLRVIPPLNSATNGTGH